VSTLTVTRGNSELYPEDHWFPRAGCLAKVQSLSRLDAAEVRTDDLMLVGRALLQTATTGERKEERKTMHSIVHIFMFF
jgi:hypothetical protein